mmetsp:Transcript_12977/g.21493  ORF Transcript_12977/g.21493 Transcript_12977/m.21493 type:complete len:303 (-) Transcript_12977:451-1359(-)
MHLSLELLNGRDLLGHRSNQKLIVGGVPVDRLFQLVTLLGTTIAVKFDRADSLGLQKAIPVMTVGLHVVLNSQQVVQRGFGKWNALIHRVQIIRIHCCHQLCDQMKTLRVRQSSTLISHHFGCFVIEVISLGTVWSNLFGIFHPFDLGIFVGTTEKGDWILGWIFAVLQHVGNVLLRKSSTIWDTITEKVAGNAPARSHSVRFLDFFKGRSRSRWAPAKGLIDLTIGILEQGLWVTVVASNDNAIRAVQKANVNLGKGNMGQDFHHFLHTGLGFLPTSLGTTSRIKGISLQRHTATIIHNEF